ncbi:hypothetical protein [Flagellimonas lutimaris]
MGQFFLSRTQKIIVYDELGRHIEILGLDIEKQGKMNPIPEKDF